MASRRRIAAHTRVGLTGEQRRYDPLARGELPFIKRLGKAVAAFLGSTMVHGAIVVLSSVAGERPRKANFVYGSSKAGLDAFATGLGDALQGTGVHVMVVRPGFVRTKMTAHLEPAPLSTTPEQVADAIVLGLRRRKETIWVPGAMRFVMSALRHVPRPIFRKLPV